MATAAGAHVGGYLIGDGRPARSAWRRCGSRCSTRCAGAAGRHGVALYLGAIALGTGILTACLLRDAYAAGTRDWMLLLAGLLAALATSQLAVALVNRLASALAAPEALPQMDFSRGIPPPSRTLVVVPAMLADAAQIDAAGGGAGGALPRQPRRQPALRAAHRLPGRGPGNAAGGRGAGAGRARRHRRAQPQVPQRRALLPLPSPAALESRRAPLDGLRAQARQALAAQCLPARRPHGSLFARGRRDGGAAHGEVRDHARHRHAAAARRGAPAGRRHGAPAQRVSSTAILQPRMAVSLPATSQSRYAQLFGAEPGIDPYTRAVSDVYQDLFGEGSFIGKGIYDVDAFERALAGRFPENRILSHDLLEGCYARSGLLSDVELYEEYPSRYSADVSRRHRWIRGDWQIARWLLPRVPVEGAARHKNPLSWLSQWKILDNLRRSVAPRRLVALLFAGWTAGDARDRSWYPPCWRPFWRCCASPPTCRCAGTSPRRCVRRRAISRRRDSRSRASRTRRSSAWTRSCEPRAACWSPIRGCWSGRPPASGPTDGASSFRSMWIGPVVAIAAVLWLSASSPAALALAAPVLLLWLASPAIAWWISRPLARREARLTGGADRFPAHDRAQDLGVLRDFRRPGGSLAAAGQLPGAPGGGRRAPHLADQHGARAAGEPVGVRLRLSQRRRADRAHRQRARHDAGPGAPPRPLLQLVRHALAQAAAAAVRLVGGQRQPRLPSAHLAAGAARARRREHPRAALLRGPARYRGIRRRCEPSGGAGVGLPLAAGDGERGALPSRAMGGASQGRAARPANRRRAGRSAAFSLSRRRGHSDGARARRPEQRIGPARAGTHRGARAPGAATRASWRAWSTASWSTRRASCSPSATTSPSCGATRAATTCSLPRRARRTFVAIAQGQLPQESWFALGRLLTTAGGEPALLSWSGSMFEYLMPHLVMPAYENTLLERTCHAAVNRQIAYGRECGVPWGMSESGYNTVDAALNYQYRAFGVPGLGLKRGLTRGPGGGAVRLGARADGRARGGVQQPAAARRRRARRQVRLLRGDRLHRLARAARPGDTRGTARWCARSWRITRAWCCCRSPTCCSSARCRSASRPTCASRRRCCCCRSACRGRARSIWRAPGASTRARPRAARRCRCACSRRRTRRSPRCSCCPTAATTSWSRNAGGGYSRWKDLAVTRWREDAHLRPLGQLLLPARCGERRVLVERAPALAQAGAKLRGDLLGSARRVPPPRPRLRDAHRDRGVVGRRYRAAARCASPTAPRTRRTIEVTSYAEVVLAPPAADALHPAFSNLFVQTEIVRERQAILCTRRPRSAAERAPWMFHLMAVHGARGRRDLLRDRSRALHRARRQRCGAAGDATEPRFRAARARCSIRSWRSAAASRSSRGRSATIDMVYGIGETREACLALAGKYQDRHLADRVFDLASTHSWVTLRQINATESDAQLYGRLASSVLYANAALRAEAGVLVKNRRGQSGLWGYAISGDLPIVLLKIGDAASIELVRQLVQAHAYWRLKGLAVDLVIWNEDHAGYRQLLQDQIMGLIAAGIEAQVMERPGRHLRAPRGADLGRGPRPVRIGRARGDQRQARERWPSRSAARRLPSGASRARAARWDAPRLRLVRSEPRRRRRAGAQRPRVFQRHAADSAPMAASTSSRLRPASARRRRGSTCSPTRSSAPWSRRAASATPGARTPTSSG